MNQMYSVNRNKWLFSSTYSSEPLTPDSKKSVFRELLSSFQPTHTCSFLCTSASPVPGYKPFRLDDFSMGP